MITELRQPLPVKVKHPRTGEWMSAYAYFLIYDKLDDHIAWHCCIDETAEFWTVENPDVRGTQNFSFGRKDGQQKMSSKEMIQSIYTGKMRGKASTHDPFDCKGCAVCQHGIPKVEHCDDCNGDHLDILTYLRKPVPETVDQTERCIHGRALDIVKCQLCADAEQEAYREDE